MGQCGPKTPAKFESVNDKVEQGRCITVTARNLDEGMEKMSFSSEEMASLGFESCVLPHPLLAQFIPRAIRMKTARK